MDIILKKLTKYFENKDKIKELQLKRKLKSYSLVCEDAILAYENYYEQQYRPYPGCQCEKCKLMRLYHNKIHNTKMTNYKLMRELKELTILNK